MSELSRYVDELFSRHKKSRQTEDLKAEILGNLEAKKADLVSSGLNESDAIQKAKESITSIDFLIDGNKRVYYNQMKLEFVQWSLIILLIGWILTIPLIVFRMGLPANWIMFLGAVAVGLYYLVLRKRQVHDEKFITETGFINTIQYKKIKRIVWILWSIFAVISLLATTALNFGSNLWFSRRIRIDGPYALAVLLIAYFVPMLTVIIPIITSIPVRLISKYEVGESNEK
jgi:hypothetical protein